MLLLPAFIALFGVAAALFLVGSTGPAVVGRLEARPDAADARTERMGVLPTGLEDYDDGYDDDDYVEYTLPPPSAPIPEPAESHAGDDAEPLNARVEHLRPAPAGIWHSSPVQEWQHLLDEPGPASGAEPIGFVHNGFHVDDEQRFRPIAEFAPPVERGRPSGADEHPFFDEMEQIYGDHAWHAGTATGSGEHHRSGYERRPHHKLRDEPPRNKHHSADHDDLDGYGPQFFPDS